MVEHILVSIKAVDTTKYLKHFFMFEQLAVNFVYLYKKILLHECNEWLVDVWKNFIRVLKPSVIQNWLPVGQVIICGKKCF